MAKEAKRQCYNFSHHDGEWHIGYEYYDENGRSLDRPERVTLTDEELYQLLKPVLKTGERC